MAEALPPGVSIDTSYDRTDLVRRTIQNGHDQAHRDHERYE